MGRIKTMLTKRTGSNMFRDNPDTFTIDFSHNKKALGEIAQIHSKKLRNVIAGYITKQASEKAKKTKKSQ